MNRRTLLTVAALGAGAVALTGAPARSLKLGKGPATCDKVQLKVENYLSPDLLPAAPDNFGHYGLIRPNCWGVLGNDLWGNCLFAGAAHEHMVWSRLGGNPADFTYSNVMNDYAAATVFDPTHGGPSSNPTDKGGTLHQTLQYRRNHGIVDSVGRYHRIEAYAHLSGNNPESLAQASYLFTGVGVGFEMPVYGMYQFNSGEPWDLMHRSHSIVGGHYVPVLGRRDGYFVTVSWGKIQLMSPAFYETYADESYALFDMDFLHDDESPEGFDRTALLRDLEILTA